MGKRQRMFRKILKMQADIVMKDFQALVDRMTFRERLVLACKIIFKRKNVCIVQSVKNVSLDAKTATTEKE